MQIDISKALLSLNPNAIWRIEGQDYESIVWMCGEPMPTKEEVEAEIERLQALPEPVVDAKQSALNKLMALGLTEEEALALGK